MLLAGCDERSQPSDPCDEPVYAGTASDEAWLTLLDAYAQAALDDPDAVTLVLPVDGQALDGAPVAFTWTSPLAAAPELVPGPTWARPAGPMDRAAAALAALWSGPAHAHLPPITGDIYYLEVKVPGATCGVRALTTDEAWLPPADTWERLRGAGALELVVTSAYLASNRILEGPYRTVVHFEVR